MMNVNLLKRLESSVYSFRLSLERIKTLIDQTIATIDSYESSGKADLDVYEAEYEDDLDIDDQNSELFSIGKKVRIDLEDVDYISWKKYLADDSEVLELLLLMITDITPEHDTKLMELKSFLSKKIEHPVNDGNRKVLTSTGDENPLSPEEKGDLEYRKVQLKRLQSEVVDMEDMSSGISIMDLGLNEFRLDLLDYVKTHDDIEKKPKGLHAVVRATDELPAGVIFVLRNVNNSVNIDNQNRIHPFYMVYIQNDGEVKCNYLNPKKLLDDMRLLCRGQDKPIPDLCRKFNDETDDGRNMSEMSELLSLAIDSIIDTKEESDIDSLFKPGGTTALKSTVSGLEDFELICFLVVKE